MIKMNMCSYPLPLLHRRSGPAALLSWSFSNAKTVIYSGRDLTEAL